MKIKYAFSVSLTAILFFLTAFALDANAQKRRGDQPGSLGDIPGTDLFVTTSDTPDPVMRGANVTYTITVSNSTSVAAQNVTLRAFVSTNSTFVSFNAPAGFTCTTPPVGETGQINCSAPSVAGSSNAVFTLVANVDSSAGLGASLYMPVDIRASNDTNGGNNSTAEVTELTGGLFVSDAGGNYQTTNINTPFPQNLRVRVTDGNENPLSGVQVTFTAPTEGASGTFAGGSTTATVTSDQNGIATAPTFTANAAAGSYLVSATAPEANGGVEFYLTNVAPMTYTVDNTNDSGAGSLRQAIEDANNNSGDDTIVFDAAIFSTPQTITLTSGVIFINSNGALSINGSGADRLTISGGNSSGIFDIGGAEVTINDLKLADGNSDTSGGAITAAGADLKINRCAFYNNAAENGGAIESFSTELTVTQSTFSGNQARANDGIGGAIVIFSFEGSSTTSITNSTFNQNTASRGGAIYKGIPIFGGDPLELNLTSVTIAGNTATDTGGGAFVIDGSFNVINSIIAGNSSDDINGTIRSRGYNLIQSTTNTTFSGGAPQQTDIIGVSPMLAPLANNGGTTDTMALTDGSPAIDKGTSANVQVPAITNRQKASKASQIKAAQIVAPLVTTDQRGAVRPNDLPNIPNTGDGSDIGAFEVAAPTAANAGISGRVTMNDGGGLIGASVILTDQNGQRRTVRTSSFGYFSFEDVPAGDIYVITVRHKLHQFAPQVITVNEDLQNLVFTPVE